jgi:sugar diacid utilization regulator
MSTVAPRRPRPRASAQAPPPAGDHELREYSSALAALGELAPGALAGLGPREALRLLAARVCSVLEIKRCSVYVRDDPREVFVGYAAHPGAELESAVRRLVLGGPTDRITREILDTHAPVLIRDARSDPRALTTAVRTWKLRSLLGVPMVAGDQVLGLLMLDHGSEVHRYAPVDLEVASAFGALGGSLLTMARETSGLRASLETANRQNRLLRRTAMAEHRLSDAILRGGGLRSIVELVCTLTGKPAALYDVHGQPVASCSPAEAELSVTLLQDARDDVAVRAVLEEVVAGASATIEPTVGADVRRRHLAAPVDVGGDRWGWLVIMEHPSRLAAFDDFLLRRAATHLALELAGHRQMVSSSADGRALLARQLVRGTTVEDDLRRNAEYLGVGLDAHRVVAYCNVQPDEVDATRLVEALRERTGADVLATRGPEGVALLADVPDSEVATLAVRRIKRCLREALEAVSDDRLLVGVSTVCRTPSEVPGGYRIARQVARCIESFSHGSDHRVLAADDLGPGRLFVANGHPEEIQRFVEDVLGPLLVDDESCADLVRTLEAFYATGRSVRLASEKLRVHENTVRYRLARVHAITGLDVTGDTDDQLSVQVALLVLRLQGHPTLRSFEEEDAAAEPSDATLASVATAGRG